MGDPLLEAFALAVSLLMDALVAPCAALADPMDSDAAMFATTAALAPMRCHLRLAAAAENAAANAAEVVSP